MTFSTKDLIPAKSDERQKKLSFLSFSCMISLKMSKHCTKQNSSLHDFSKVCLCFSFVSGTFIKQRTFVNHTGKKIHTGKRDGSR